MKCEHPACQCEAPQGRRHCSAACEHAAADDEQCDCGHTDCE